MKAGGTPERLAKGVPKLGAPQAAALQSAIEMVQEATSGAGESSDSSEGGIIDRLEKGGIPVYKYLAGAAIGLLVSLLVSPGLGVMIGLSLYLPFEYMIVFGIGGLLSIFITRKFGARFAEDKGVPIAAGLIVGDALVGIVHAIYKVAALSMVE